MQFRVDPFFRRELNTLEGFAALNAYQFVLNDDLC